MGSGLDRWSIINHSVNLGPLLGRLPKDQLTMYGIMTSDLQQEGDALDKRRRDDHMHQMESNLSATLLDDKG